jgi:CRISPR-associated endonuclease/helicase Cas3
MYDFDFKGTPHSHPHTLLSDHLSHTTESIHMLYNAYCNPDVQKMVGLSEDVRIGLGLHDIGKLNTLFAERLSGDRNNYGHSAPGALCVASMFDSALPETALLFEVIRHHHGYMSDTSKMSDWWNSHDIEKERAYALESLSQWNESISKEIYSKLSDISAWENLKNNMGEHRKQRCKRTFQHVENFIKARCMASLLVVSDRLDACGLPCGLPSPLPHFERPLFPPPPSAREQARNEWRENIRKETLHNVASINSPGIYTLTAPTGSGKTLLGTEAACVLADNLKKHGHTCRHIITALPFISLVEQTSSVLQSCFPKETVTLDHSLATYDEQGSTTAHNMSQEMFSFLYRAWETPIVVTTLAHMWSVFFNPKILSTMNYIRLAGSIVIIDEPQSLGMTRWPTFRSMCSYISKMLGTTFIFMTATQPQELEISKEGCAHSIELYSKKTHTHKNAQKGHDNFARTYIWLPMEKQTINELQETIWQHEDPEHSSGLCVLNTKKSALKFFSLFRDSIHPHIPVYFLSGWQCIADRRRIMACIKADEQAGRVHHLVATQVVESGSDLDFKWGYRDMAPLESVQQTGGRINRHGIYPFGTLYVSTLVDVDSPFIKTYGSYIYNATALDITQSFLKTHKKCSDEELSDFYVQYQNLLQVQGVLNLEETMIRSGKWRTGYVPCIENMEFDFKNAPVFVDSDNTLDMLFDELRSLHGLSSRSRRKVVANTLQQHRVDISEKELRKWIDIDARLIEKIQVRENAYVYKIGHMGIRNGVYRTDTGFMPVDSVCHI